MRSPLQPSVFSVRLFWVVLTGCLLPWFWVRVQQGSHSDILWLSESLMRLIKGGSMTDSVYEVNPPLSILIYILPVLANKLLGIPLHCALFAHSCFLVFVSALAVWAIIRRWPFLTTFDVCALLSGYIFANTILTSLMFGERDHYIGLALAPFVLLQIAITFGLPYPRKLVWPAFLIGAVFILLKPHHGLLPTILLIHRVIRQKRLSVMKDPDFLSLAAMTVGYLATIWFFFRDYITTIYPDVLHLYLPLRDDKEIIVKTMFFLYIGIVGGLLTLALRLNNENKTFILFLVFSGMISLIPVYVQGMGFNYHFFPTFSFYTIAASLLVMNGISNYVKNRNFALCFTIIALSALAYQVKPLNINFPKYSEYTKLPLTQMIQKKCAGDPSCSFFIFHKNMGMIHETSHYSGIPHASRFASFWFLPALVREERALREGKKSSLSPEELKHLQDKYGTMVAEDIEHYRPKIMIIWTGVKIDDEDFDFISYFSKYPEFARQLKNYKKTDRINLSMSDYYRDSEFDYKWNLEYDVYERIKNLENSEP